MSTELKTNKAGIKPIPVDLYKISAGDLKKFLEDQVFMHEIGVEFERFVGSNGAFSYVKMTCLFRKSDIIANKAGTDGTDHLGKMLEQTGAGMNFTDVFKSAIERYKYPAELAGLFSNPNMQVEAREAVKAGISGPNFESLIAGNVLRFDQVRGILSINLRPDVVIKDMLADGVTNKIEGKYRIDSITGNDSDSIIWNVIISKYDSFGKSSVLNPLFGS